MKNKLPKDLFDTACWSKGCITKPMKVLAEVFSYDDIENLRGGVRRMATYACADKLYQLSAPCDVLLDMKVVRSALLAAHALRKRTGAAIDSPAVRLVTPFVDYCCGVGEPNPWGDFPRSLSIKEYCRPYGVFAKLFSQQQLALWLSDWEAGAEPGQCGAAAECYVYLYGPDKAVGGRAPGVGAGGRRWYKIKRRRRSKGRVCR